MHPNGLAHLTGGFAVEPSAQDDLRKCCILDFHAAQPGQVQPLLGGPISMRLTHTMEHHRSAKRALFDSTGTCHRAQYWLDGPQTADSSFPARKHAVASSGDLPSDRMPMVRLYAHLLLVPLFCVPKLSELIDHLSVKDKASSFTGSLVV